MLSVRADIAASHRALKPRSRLSPTEALVETKGFFSHIFDYWKGLAASNADFALQPPQAGVGVFTATVSVVDAARVHTAKQKEALKALALLLILT